MRKHHAVFGRGKLKNRTEVAFVLSVNDLVAPGRGKDRVKLEVSSGYVTEGALVSRNLKVKCGRQLLRARVKPKRGPSQQWEGPLFSFRSYSRDRQPSG